MFVVVVLLEFSEIGAFSTVELLVDAARVGSDVSASGLFSFESP